MSDKAQTLILGWGNPGRLDDGLGPAFAEALERRALPDVTVDSDYQLTMEDAAEVARYARVVFVDADRAGPAPFHMRRLRPTRDGSSFSTHSVAAGAVLALSRDLFGGEPEAWQVGIRGYDFDEFGEGLSEQARENLQRAVTFVSRGIASGELAETDPPEGEPCPTKNR